MFSKNTAILFLLFANLILFAHAVIPHHHHDQHVCIESIICDNHRHNDFDHHPKNDHTDECLLHQLIVVPTVLSFKDIMGEAFVKDEFYINLDLNLFLTKESNLDDDVETRRRFYLNPIQTPLVVNCGLGLRAPPIII